MVKSTNEPNLANSDGGDDHLNPITASVLERFSRRRNRLLWLRAVAVGVVVLSVMVAIAGIADYAFPMSRTTRSVLSLSAYAVTALMVWWTSLRFLGGGNPAHVARQIETLDPRYRKDLLSAVELSDPELANGSEEFRTRLQEHASRRVAGLNLSSVLPVSILRPWIISSLLMVCIAFLLFFVPHLQIGRRIARVLLPGVPIERASLIKLEILQPDPASRYVAQGDAIAVVVAVRHVRGLDQLGDVVMEYRSDEVSASEILMSPRMSNSSNQSQTDPNPHSPGSSGQVFAANLAVGQSKMQYRIRSGDAVTLWNTLTPRARPRVKSFTKRYLYPSYSGLAERTEKSEHGDLEALAGTTAWLTVEFDQAVANVVIKYGNRGVEFPLDPVDGSDRVFQAKIPMKTPGQYQLDSVSIASQLSNPFSPQYMISPQIDRKPIVQWNQEVERTRLVSPMELVDLSASVIDDLPIENVFQVFEVTHRRTPFKRVVKLDASLRELDLSWQWDLINPMNRSDVQEPELEFQSGDIVTSRLVAIDRAGNRSESSPIELLVVEQGFDSDRHVRIERLREHLRVIANWAARLEEKLSDLREPIKQLNTSDYEAMADSILEELKKTEQWIDYLKLEIGEAEHLGAAGNLELLGRGVGVLKSSIQRMDTELRDALARDQDPWRNERRNRTKQLSSESQRLSQSANRIEQFTRAIIAHELTVNVVADEMALLSSIRPLVEAGRSVPVNRYPHFMKVASTRLDALTGLIDRNHEPLPESTLKHFNHWQAWGELSAGVLRGIEEENLSFDETQRRVERFRGELAQKVRHSTLDSKIGSMLQRGVREIRTDVSMAGIRLSAMQKNGEFARRERKHLEKEKNTDNIVRRKQSLAHSKLSSSELYSQLISQLDGEEALHRSRKYVDLQFAADINLFKRAVRTVARDGYLDYQETPASEVHEELRKAFCTLECAHELDIFRRELVQLADDETGLIDRAATRIDHPARLERYESGYRYPLGQLQPAGLSWELIKPLYDAHHGQEYQQAAGRIVKRRWSDDKLISGQVSLRALSEQIREGLGVLDTSLKEARQTIAKYVPSISELARQAAKKANQAKSKSKAVTPEKPSQQKTESPKADPGKPKSENPESKDPESKDPESKGSESKESDAEKPESPDPASQEPQQPEPQQPADVTPKDAIEAAHETIEALHDFANTTKITDQPRRELARDADAAAAQIHEMIKEVEQYQSQPHASAEHQDEQLDELAKALNHTADHFEKAEKGDDVSRSREELRQLEKEAGANEEIANRSEQEQAMASAAQDSPEDLLRKLEEELRRNPKMQQELSKIAGRTSESVQSELEQMVRDEQSINQSIERSDSKILERKRRTTRELQSLVRDLGMMDRSMLETVRRAQEWGEFKEQQEALGQSREQLRKAVEKIREPSSENASLEAIDAATRAAATAIKKAEEQLANVAENASENTKKELDKDERTRNNEKRQIKTTASNARRQRLDHNRQTRNQWVRYENEAKRRVTNAQRKERDHQRQIDQLKKRYKREEKNRESIQGQIDQIERRNELAIRDQESAKRTAEYAEQRKEESDQQRSEIEKTPLPKLEKENPAAEVAEYFADETRNELKRMRKRLGEISREVDAIDDLRSPASTAASLARKQEQIANDAAGAAEALRRAARHEDRLNEKLTSEQLEEAAKKIEDEAHQSSAKASKQLEKASEDAAESPRASRSIKQAEDAIKASADSLGEMLSKTSENEPDANASNEPRKGSEPPSQRPSTQRPSTQNPSTQNLSTQRRTTRDQDEATKKALQLAKTLDELDRSIHSSRSKPGDEQNSDNGESDANELDGEESDGEASSEENQQGEPQGDPGQSGKPKKNAADASQTLAEAISELAQQAARKRADSLKPPGDPSKQPGQGPPKGKQQGKGSKPGKTPSGKPADQSGKGEMPSGGSLNASDISRLGENWGNLRSRRTDDAAQGASLRVPRQYRREIQAYFQAIAERSGNQTGAPAQRASE